MKEARAPRLSTLVKPLVGLSLLGWLLWQLQWAELAGLMTRPQRGALWLGAACLVASFLLLQPLRLHSVLGGYTGSLSASFRLSMVGALFNNLLPSNVGGDAVRLLYLVRARPGNLGAPLALLLLLRLSQIGVLLAAAAACALADLPRLVALLSGRLSLPRDGALWLGLGLLACTALLALLLRSALGRRVRARAGAVVEQARHGVGELSLRSLSLLLGHTLLYHALRVAGFCLLCSYAGAPLGWADAVLVLALTALAGLVPITVGGLGVMEGAIAVGLLLFGVPHAAALGVALVNRASLLPPALVGGVIYTLDRDRLTPSGAKIEKPDAA